jgi:hypothetical protein
VNDDSTRVSFVHATGVQRQHHGRAAGGSGGDSEQVGQALADAPPLALYQVVFLFILCDFA